nr:RNA-dependent RNA polymerase [Flumine sobemo-like virus 11]
MPERTFSNEYKSLCAHARRFNPAQEPCELVYGNTISHLSSVYPRAIIPPVIRQVNLQGSFTDEYLHRHLDFICARRIEHKADPGYPWRAFGRTKGQVISTARAVLFSTVTTRLRALCSWDCTAQPLSASELIKAGLCDVVKVFIKNEPHKNSKILSDFLRLISNVSVADEMIDRMIFGPQNEIEIDNWDSIPSKPGIGFTDEMIQDVADDVLSKSFPIAEGDSSTWDWTVQGWELRWAASVRTKLMNIPEDSVGARLIRNRIYCVANKVFALSDGRLFEQLYAGIMASGWYNTSSDNSRIVGINCSMASASWWIAMGDDFLCENVPRLREVFERNGHILKEFRVITDTFEFCSTVFPSGEPVNVWKTFVRLLMNGNKSVLERYALYTQWQYDMRNCTIIEELQALIQASGFLDE